MRRNLSLPISRAISFVALKDIAAASSLSGEKSKGLLAGAEESPLCPLLLGRPTAASSFFCLPLYSPTSCSRLVRERKPAKSWDRFSAQQEAPPTMTAILRPAPVSLYHITLHCIQLAYLRSAMRSHPDFVPLRYQSHHTFTFGGYRYY